MPNVVEIVIRGKNLAGTAIKEVDAQAAGAGQTLSRIGRAAGVAFAAAGYEGVRMAAKFQGQMEQLSTQAGVSQDKIAGLSASVLQLAGQVGFSPDSLAQSLYHVESNFSSMGISSAKALQIVKTAAEGAAVGNADLVDVTNALTAAVASGIPGVRNMSQAMGALNAIVGAGDMTMQDLADAFSTGLPAVMKGYGLSLRDVGAALATFGDLNMRGANAAGALRMAVMHMAVPTAQGKKDFASMGMSVNQLATDMAHGGLLPALLDLQKHYARLGITGSAVGRALTADFGAKAGPGLAVLMDQIPRLESKYRELGKAAGGFGAAWAATQATTQQKMKEFGASFDAMLIRLGDALLPVLVPMMRVTGAVLDWLGANHLLIPSLIAVGVALSFATGGLSIIIPTILLVVAGIVDLWQHSQTFRQIVTDAFANTAKNAGDSVRLILDGLQLLASVFLAVAGSIIDGAAKAFGWLPKIGPKLKEAAKAFDGFSAGVRDTLQAAQDKIHQYQTSAANMPKIIRLQGDITDLQAKLAASQRRLATWSMTSTARAKILADDADLKRKILADKLLLAALNGTTAITYIQTRSVGGGRYITGAQASGGIAGAAAGGIRRGLTMVGEHGRELVELAPGSRVHSNPDTERMLAGGGGGTVQVVLELAAGSAADQGILTALARAIRVRGGNVQTVLGHG